jgi:pyruvate-formate lyase-activating enzyme
MMEDVGRFLAGLSDVLCVRLLEYHNFAQSKYSALGSAHQMPPLPEEGKTDACKAVLLRYGLKVIP